MKHWRLWLALYSLGMIVTYGHVFREDSTKIVRRCNNPGTKQEACFDTLVYDFPGVPAWFASLFWPYHWSEVAWRQKP